MTETTIPTPAPILVTGAAGFIGAAVCAALADAGFTVRAGLRRATLPAILEGRPGIWPVRGDLDDPAALRFAVADAALVIHAAWGDDTRLAARTSALLAAMSAAGVARFVQMSSIAVYGDRTGPIDETMTPIGRLDPYARAKLDCEAVIRSWVADPADERRALALRPGIVYGARSLFWIEKMLARIRAGAWGTFGPAGEGNAALVHVDDLADLAVTAARRLTDAAEASLPPFVALDVVGPDQPTWNTYFEELAAAAGAPPLRPLSSGTIALRRTLAVPAKIARRLGLPFGRRLALAPTPGELALFARHSRHSTDAARRLLGWAPSIGLAEGLARSLAAHPRRDTDQTKA